MLIKKILDMIMEKGKMKGNRCKMRMYRKKRYVVTAEKVPVGTRLNNFLEGRYYKTSEDNCIKIIGTVGETWPVTIEELCKNYTFVDGKSITADSIPSGEFMVRTIVEENEENVFAVQTKSRVYIMTRNEELVLSNRIGIPHGKGDFIVYSNNHGKPNFHDTILVNGIVFFNIYEDVTKK